LTRRGETRHAHGMFLDQLRMALAFYTRLPVACAGAAPDFARASWPVAVVGSIVGAGGGLCASLLHLAGLSAEISAVGALVAMACMTGALHEDGLADFVDGVGGGVDRATRLAIMRDSRLGSYGALALCAGVLLRMFAIAGVMDFGALGVISLLSFVGAVSRVAGLMPMLHLAPARTDGAGVGVRPPTGHALAVAGGVVLSLGVAPALAGVAPGRLLAASILAVAGALLVTVAARRSIGGYTGDVLGAAQQLAEIAALLVLCAR
jgi:adenosylcobinamide-GDP ribazoletransferase